jgi:hypothetical protein
MLRNLLPLLLLALLGLLVYAPALTIGYLSDDFDWMALVVSPDYSAFDAMTTAGTGNYFRPLVTLSLRLEHRFAANHDATPHHVGNLLLHLASAGLLYLTARQITPRTSLALACALLFLFHPIAVPNVYWIASRVDSLMTVCYLLSILGFATFLRGGWGGWLLVSWLGLGGALLSKEMAVTAIGSLGLLLAIFKLHPTEPLPPPRHRWALAMLAAMLLTTLGYLGYLGLRFYRDTATPSQVVLSPSNALTALVASFAQLLWPNSQSALIELYRTYPWLALLGAALGLLAALAPALWLWRRGERKKLALLAALAALALVSLLPLLVTAALSRRMYLPLAMLCITLAFLPWLAPILARRLPLLLYPLALFGALVSMVHGQVWIRNWHITQTFCRQLQPMLADLPPLTRLIFLSAPAQYQDVPVFANDLNEALHFCLEGRFGQYAQFHYLGTLMTTQSQPDPTALALYLLPDHTYEVISHTPDSYFYFGPGVKVGNRYDHEDYSLTVTTLNGPNRVSRFTVAFVDTALLAQTALFYFNGKEFHHIKP